MNDLEYLVDQLYTWYEFFEGNVREYQLHISYMPLFDIIRQGYIYEYMEFDDKLLTPLKYDAERRRPIILYSGGKCSTALALEQSNKDSILFYAGEEDSWIDDFSKDVGMDYHVSILELNYGNPLYLLCIIGEAIIYAVNNNLSPIIYAGTFEMSSIHNNPVSMWANCIELIQAFEAVMGQVVPDLKILLPMPSYSYVWDTLMKNKGYLKYIRTDTALDEMIFCIAKEDWWIEDCNDYLLYIKKLRKLYYNEVGYKASLEEFWKRYFFYDISRSRHNPEMKKLFGE